MEIALDKLDPVDCCEYCGSDHGLDFVARACAEARRLAQMQLMDECDLVREQLAPRRHGCRHRRGADAAQLHA
jgi:hypothetical protein